MFVYDITNYSSFENLDDWYSYVKKCFRDAGSDMPKCALVANKSESSVVLGLLHVESPIAGPPCVVPVMMYQCSGCPL